MRDSLHYRLHDWYGYLGFLIHLPFHLHHKHPNSDYNIITLKGAIVCECEYTYDRGYYLMNCERCYNYETKRLQTIGDNSP